MNAKQADQLYGAVLIRPTRNIELPSNPDAPIQALRPAEENLLRVFDALDRIVLFLSSLLSRRH